MQYYNEEDRHLSKKINSNIRKWSALLVAIVMYFVVHEGAHLIYALLIGRFKQINIIGFGIQIDIFDLSMTNTQIGIFSLVGPLATVIFGYILIGLTNRFLQSQSRWFRAITYYMTLVFLIVDPLYLTCIYSFVGGGDMNGIVLLASELYVRIIFGVILLANLMIIYKYVLSQYNKAYQKLESNKIAESKG